MKEKIVIIGSNSFSGSHFVAHCLRMGLTVLGISRSAELAPCFLPYRWEAKEGALEAFTFCRYDMNCDSEKMLGEIEKFKPDFIVNFAAQGMVAESWQYPLDWYQTNLLANVRLHEGLRHFSWLKKYVHISTPEVYGSCSGKVTEEHSYHPSTPYAASRAACDLHLNTFHARYGFPWTFTRSANVYGAGQQLYRIIPRTVLFIRQGKRLPLHGGGHSVRSFIHIRDVCEATLKVARIGKTGQGYHLSTDRFISIRELVALICVRMGVPFESHVEIVDDRPGKDAAYLLSAEKAKAELDWNPTINLETGIDEVIRWVDTHFDELNQQPNTYIHKP